MSNSIFVQIASYRDPELVPTILDLLDKAKNPENIKIAVVYQYGGDSFDKNLKEINSKIKLLEVDHKESKGACWARNLVQKFYSGEDFSLQLDSHHRFEKNWDETILEVFKNLNDEKAVLTGYPAQYAPDWNYDQYHKEVYICKVHSFSADGKPEAVPHTFENWQNADRPRRAVHIAAGFIFAKGEINNIAYDPNLYFTGEECSLAVRYFTHGYNLYHPHKLICYHYYTRNEQPKHWSDHKNWFEYDRIASQRLNCLLGRESCDLGIYGLGNERTLKDWRDYSGIDFEHNIIHRDTAEGLEPPCKSEDGWKKEEVFDYVVSWDDSIVEKCPDPRFWGFFVVDHNKVALFREDITDINIMTGAVKSKRFTFKHRGNPNQLLIWPYSESTGWLNNVYQPLIIK